MSKSTGAVERRQHETEMMCNLYLEGKTIAYIADMFGKKRDTVSQRLDKAGVYKRRVMGTAGAKYTPEEMAAIRNFIALPWNLRNWRELLRQLPGRTRSGVQVIVNRIQSETQQYKKKREVRSIPQAETVAYDVPAGYYRASNGVVLKHISLQGDMSHCYRRNEAVL